MTAIHQINKDLIGKFDLKDGDAWIVEMYKQFGINSMEEIKKISSEDTTWYNKYRWDIGCEDAFLDEVMKKNKAQVRKIGKTQVKLNFAWMSLGYGPGIAVEGVGEDVRREHKD